MSVSESRVITAPTATAVSAAEFRSYARITGTTEAHDVETVLQSAQDAVEADLGRQLVTATYELTLTKWPGRVIELPRPPLASVTSVKYDDSADAEQTLVEDTDYRVSTKGIVGFVEVIDGGTWPEVRRKPEAIRIRYVCGYGNADDVPVRIKTAIKRAALYLWTNRGDVAEMLPPHVIAPAAALRVLGRGI